jgi:hypothetical protein
LKTFKSRFENFEVKIKNFQLHICKEVCERLKNLERNGEKKEKRVRIRAPKSEKKSEKERGGGK